MHAPARLPFSGSGQLGRSQIAIFSFHTYPPAKVLQPCLVNQRQQLVVAATSSANEQDGNGFFARLNSLRRSPSVPASGSSSSSDDPQPEQSSRGSAEHLRSSSENLRILLERRARRQNRASDQAASTADGQSEATGLVPSSGGDAAVPARYGGSDMEPGAGGRRTTRVRFWLKFRAEWGQRLKVVGSHDHLGQWGLDGAPELKWSEGDMWHTMVDLPAGTIVEYKYVLLDHSGQHAIAWQRGNNSVLAVRHSDEFVEVFDNWGGDPGAQVVSDGGPPTTREGRLLSWAGEVDAQLNAQRSELRRARMELVASQEDAKMARQDAQRYRTQLAQQEAEKMVAIARAKELEVANQVLHAKLDDVTRSFREALETAAELMDDTDAAMGEGGDGSSGEGGSGMNGIGMTSQGNMGPSASSSEGERGRLGAQLGQGAGHHSGAPRNGSTGGVNGQGRGWGVNGSGAAGDGVALRRRRAGQGPSPLPGVRPSAARTPGARVPAKLPRTQPQRRPAARRRAPLLPTSTVVAAAAATTAASPQLTALSEVQEPRTRSLGVAPGKSGGGGSSSSVSSGGGGGVLMRGSLGLSRAAPPSPSSTPRSGSPARLRRAVRVAAVPAAKTGHESEGASPAIGSYSSGSTPVSGMGGHHWKMSAAALVQPPCQSNQPSAPS